MKKISSALCHFQLLTKTCDHDHFIGQDVTVICRHAQELCGVIFMLDFPIHHILQKVLHWHYRYNKLIIFLNIELKQCFIVHKRVGYKELVADFQ